MLFTEIKEPFSAKDVANADAYLKEITHITKPMVSMNTRVRDALITVLVGTEDKYNLIPISQRINEKFHEYYSVLAASMTGHSKRSAVPVDSVERLRIANDITILAEELSEAMSIDAHAAYTSKFNAVAAFFPVSEFAEIGEEPSSKTTYSNNSDLAFSRVVDKIKMSALKEKNFADIPEIENISKKAADDEDENDLEDLLGDPIEYQLPQYNRPGFPLIAVTPPSTGEAYGYLNDTFNNAGFILHCLRSNSASAWSKYTNGRSVPSAITWGMFLLAVGIHPAYRLVQRKNFDAYIKSDLFKDILPNWSSIFDTDVWSYFRQDDLKPYQVEKKPTHTKVDYAAMRELLKEKIVEWYAANPGKQILEYKDSVDLISKIGMLYSGANTSIELTREINKIILELSKNKAFDQSSTRLFVAAYAPPHEFSPTLDDDIFKLSRVAYFLHYDANPSPNIMAMLRHLPNRTGDISLISQLTGISQETWARYEQGTRIPYSAAWSAILLSLDLHPVYHLENRKDEVELELAYKIYMDLHFSVSRTSKDFKLPPNASFEFFKSAII